MTLEEKVGASDVIVLAEATRAFLTDGAGNELVADTGYPYQRGSWLSLKIKRVLKYSGDAPGATLTVNTPTDGSSLAALNDTYVGKDLIYFMRASRWRRTPASAPETLLQFPQARWFVYPLSAEHLPEIDRTIAVLDTAHARARLKP